MLCGGTSDAKEATPEVQEIIETVRAQVEEKLGRSIAEYTLVSYKSQVVAGMNYFAKVHIGNDEHLHLRIWRNPARVITFHSLQHSKTKDEDIAYF